MNTKRKLHSFLKDDLILHTLIVFLGTSLGGFLNLLYRLVSVRLLTPQDYGTFNALISLVMFTSVAISPLGTTLTRFFTEYITRKNFSALANTIVAIIKRLGILAVIIFLFFLFFSSFLAAFLNTKLIYVVFCGGIIIFSLFPPIITSLLQSFQKFKIYSLVGIFSSFGKLIVGSLFMFLGFGVLGGLSGFIAGPIFMLLISSVFISSVFRKNFGKINKEDITKPVSLAHIYKYFLPVSVVMFSFTLLTNIDIVLVKHFFSPLDSGFYSIAQMVGMIALFLPSALAIVIFPKSTQAYINNVHPLRLLHKSLALAGVCCLTIVLAAFLFPDLILKVLTGKVNPVSISLVGLFVVAMSFYALTWIVVNFLLSIHNTKIAIPLFLIALTEAIAIYSYHPSLKAVIYILLFFSIISFFASLFMVRVKNRKD